MRLTWGRVINTTVSERIEMDNFEEFCAILAANMYRSERRFVTLTWDHLSYQRLSRELTDSAAYYNYYRGPIQTWFASQQDFCLELAASPAAFNPLRAAADALGLTVRKR